MAVKTILTPLVLGAKMSKCVPCSGEGDAAAL